MKTRTPLLTVCIAWWMAVAPVRAQPCEREGYVRGIACAGTERDVTGCCPVVSAEGEATLRGAAGARRGRARPGCPASQHASAGHCCADGEEWVAARRACVCVDAGCLSTSGAVSDELAAPDVSPAEVRVAYERAVSTGGSDARALEREIRAFLGRYDRRYPEGSESALVVLEARARIARIAMGQGRVRDITTALWDVVEAYARSGQPRGSLAAEHAAWARFELAERDREEFSFTISIDDVATLENYVRSLSAQIEERAQRANALVESYAPILELGRPRWSLAAYAGQGRVYDDLAQAVTQAPFVMPRDLRRQIRGASPEVQEEVRVQVERRIRQTLVGRAQPVECFAIARYALAARAARAASLDTAHSRVALERLRSYPDDRLRACIDDARREDPTYSPYIPGEFAAR